MSGTVTEMRRYVDRRVRQSPAYRVLFDPLMVIEPELVSECECVSAEALLASETSLLLSHQEAIEIVQDLMPDQEAAIEVELERLALLPEGLARDWRALLHREENDPPLRAWSRCMIARLVRLYIKEAGLLAHIELT